MTHVWPTMHSTIWRNLFLEMKYYLSAQPQASNRNQLTTTNLLKPTNHTRLTAINSPRPLHRGNIPMGVLISRDTEIWRILVTKFKKDSFSFLSLCICIGFIWFFIEKSTYKIWLELKRVLFRNGKISTSPFFSHGTFTAYCLRIHAIVFVKAYFTLERNART